MSKYVMAIDQGTTGTTVLLLDRELKAAARVNHEFRQIFPRPGWVEHDPRDIWNSLTAAISGALREAGARGEDIACIGITNQRETTVLWERRSGEPVHNAIVWQCRRTAPLCRRLKEEGREELFRRKTGLVLDPYFSGTKLRWLLDEVAGARERAEKGELCFGTIDSFLAYRLSGGAVHLTDASNASRTLLLNLETLDWDEELLEVLRIPGSVLPEVRGCSEVYGETRGIDVLPDGIAIAGMAGDQQAALFGQACFKEGEAKCTYGTGAFLLMNTGERPIPSRHGLLTTVAWRLGDRTTYTLEGSAFIAGAAVQWLRDGLGIISSSAEVERLAREVDSSAGVVFVPALTGLGAPHWRAEARGLIRGIDRGTTRAHLARAALEGIAFQITDLAEAMRQDSGRMLHGFKVDGGAAINDLLMQCQADILGLEIVRPRMLETTALGTAFLAGLATGVWGGLEEIARAWHEDRRFVPSISAEQRERELTRWREAVAHA